MIIYNCFFDSSRKLKKNLSIAFLLLLFLQLAVITYWADKKTNYYIDELYSMGYARYYTDATPEAVYITESDAWKEGNWNSNRELKRLLYVTEKESIFSEPLIPAVKAILQGRNYYGFLNAFESVFSLGRVSKRPGIILNVILFCLTQFLLFYLLTELGVDSIPALLGTAMYGFSAMAVGLAVYTRFYSLCIFLYLSSILSHLHLWKKQSAKVWLTAVPTILFSLFLALRNSQLIFIAGGSLCALFSIGLLLRKRYRSFLLYFSMVISSSLLYVFRETYLIDVLFHPGNYTEVGGARGWTTKNVVNATVKGVFNYLRGYIELINRNLYGSIWAFLIIFSVIIVLAVISYRKLRNRESGERRFFLSTEEGFVLILIGVIIIYFMFAAMAGLKASRYLSFMFIPVCVVSWFVANKLIQTADLGRIPMLILGAAVAIGTLTTHFNGHIEYIYSEDKELIETLRNYNDYPVIMICALDNSRHEVYECINLMRKTARIYPISQNNHAINAEECPNEMLIWIHKGLNVDPYLTDLVGANWSLIGSTHISDVYLAVKEQQ